MESQLLILAGIYNSGPGHWQSVWQREDPAILKLEHSDWNTADRVVWVRELEAQLDRIGPRVTLIAHSLGCLLVAFWSECTRHRIDGALLVSVPDPESPAFPVDARNFRSPPMRRLAFPTAVVSSTDDPYATQAFMRRCARAWGSSFHSVGALGHINADSNLGTWEQGSEILRTLMRDRPQRSARQREDA
jgi:predicted alpha/beta hydrolase family esterase